MALKITSVVGIKKGNEISSSNECYVVIDSTEPNKAGDVYINVTTFKSQAERNADYNANQCEVQFPKRFALKGNGTPFDYTMTLESYFGVLYGYIKLQLEALGLTVVNVA